MAYYDVSMLSHLRVFSLKSAGYHGLSLTSICYYDLSLMSVCYHCLSLTSVCVYNVHVFSLMSVCYHSLSQVSMLSRVYVRGHNFNLEKGLAESARACHRGLKSNLEQTLVSYRQSLIWTSVPDSIGWVFVLSAQSEQI